MRHIMHVPRCDSTSVPPRNVKQHIRGELYCFIQANLPDATFISTNRVGKKVYSAPQDNTRRQRVVAQALPHMGCHQGPAGDAICAPGMRSADVRRCRRVTPPRTMRHCAFAGATITYPGTKRGMREVDPYYAYRKVEPPDGVHSVY